MNWFWIALVAPILWSFVNHTDKYILSKKMAGSGVRALFVFSAVFAVVVVPFSYIKSDYNVTTLPFEYVLVLIAGGLIGGIAFLFYLKSLENEDVSLAVTLFQLNPVWGYFLGLLILGEQLSINQIVASLVIMLGIFIISLDFEELKLKRISIKSRVLLFSLTASFLFALQDTVFKWVAINDAFWFANFWQYLGLFLTGTFFYFFRRKYRESFHLLVKKNNKKVISLASFSELLFLVGSISSNFAMLLAPVSLVLLVNSYQPVFVFIVSLLLAYFLPRFSMERLSAGHIIHKTLSIIIVLLGSYLLYYFS
jgi:drug/metabolite transporter (DMT)-like permease